MNYFFVPFRVFRGYHIYFNLYNKFLTLLRGPEEQRKNIILNSARDIFLVLKPNPVFWLLAPIS